MTDWTWIDDLDPGQAAQALGRSHDEVVRAEAGQFLLAAHWADLHVPQFVEETLATVPGMPGALRIAADGCPEIDEFAGAELGLLLRRSTHAAEKLLRDAVVVRHRHPMLWQGVREERVRVWMAAKVAERCTTARLTLQQAQWVDARTTPFVESLTPGRFFTLLDATIIEVDPEGAEERDRARALSRSVTTGRSDEQGMRTLVARAHAGEIAYVVAVLDRIAVILADQGDPDPLAARRATALRILANPARALALLMGAAAEGMDPETEAPSLGEEQDSRLWEDDELDTEGRPVHSGERRREQDAPPGSSEDETTQGSPCRHGQALLPPWEVLRDLLRRLQELDASTFDPVHVVHVHLSESALAARRGVVRVEGLGPITMATLRDWLTHPTSADHISTRIELRPVLDSDDVVPVDRYEIPDDMAELIACRWPFEVFPFGTASSRRADKDHRRPYRRRERGGSPGQTSLVNMQPLGRRHHRMKTHGGWMVVRDGPGAVWWRSPLGFWARVDRHGTHVHGRDPALDARWLHDPPRTEAS